MNKVSIEVVEEIWDTISGYEPEEIGEAIEKMANEQPDLYEYLESVPDEFSDPEINFQICLGLVVYESMKSANPSMRTLSWDELIEQEEVNVTMLQSLEGESEGDGLAVVQEMYSNYPQPEILGSLSAMLMADEEESIDEEEEEEMEDVPQICVENKGSMFITLKTVLDCLNK
ncbi:MAG: hypothetical protein U0264_03210 [Candidatus Kapaibacterium sp.]